MPLCEEWQLQMHQSAKYFIKELQVCCAIDSLRLCGFYSSIATQLWLRNLKVKKLKNYENNFEYLLATNIV